MPEQLINSISAQAPVFLLTIFFSNALVGLYSLPRKLLSTPVILIGNSLGQIYFRDAALKYTSQKDLAHATLKLFNLLFRIGVIPFSILIIFGDVIIELIFGHEWALAGTYSMLLSPWLFFLLIGSPLSNIFAVKGQQKKSLIISLYMFGCRLMAFLAGSIFLNSSLAAIGLFSGVSFAFWFVMAFYSLYLVKIKIWRVFIQTISLWTIVLVLMTLIRVFIFDIS
jgi:O-antigen/teichoic acid export membrane protein